MGATVLADLLARTLLPHSIMTEKLARRGVAVPGAFHADPLRTTTVRAVMHSLNGDGADPDAVTVGVDETLLAAAALMAEEDVDHLAVVDGDRVVGTCSRSDVLQARAQQVDHDRTEAGWLGRIGGSTVTRVRR